MSLRGPIFGWPFPLLNLLREVLLRQRGTGSGSERPLSVSAENVERWKVMRAPGGGIDELVIHREVKE